MIVHIIVAVEKKTMPRFENETPSHDMAYNTWRTRHGDIHVALISKASAAAQWLASMTSFKGALVENDLFSHLRSFCIESHAELRSRYPSDKGKGCKKI